MSKWNVLKSLRDYWCVKPYYLCTIFLFLSILTYLVTQFDKMISHDRDRFKI